MDTMTNPLVVYSSRSLRQCQEWITYDNLKRIADSTEDIFEIWCYCNENNAFIHHSKIDFIGNDFATIEEIEEDEQKEG